VKVYVPHGSHVREAQVSKILLKRASKSCEPLPGDLRDRGNIESGPCPVENVPLICYICSHRPAPVRDFFMVARI